MTFSSRLISARYGRLTKVQNLNDQEVGYLERLMPELKEIKDSKLREKVVEAWLVAWHKGNYDRIEDAMYEYGNAPLYQHIRVVARICMASSEILEEIHSLKFNRDYLIAAALLHDIDKFITVTVGRKGKRVRDTRFIHGYIQAKICQDVGIPDEIAHAVLIHSRRRFTFDRPDTLEAILVQDADIAAMNPLIIKDKGQLHF